MSAASAVSEVSSGSVIGRVGALAVALGIGAAVANGSAVAWADPGESDAAGASSESAASEGPSGGPAAGGGTTGSAASESTDRETAAAEGADAGDDADADADADEDDDAGAEADTEIDTPTDTPIDTVDDATVGSRKSAAGENDTDSRPRPTAVVANRTVSTAQAPDPVESAGPPASVDAPADVEPPEPAEFSDPTAVTAVSSIAGAVQPTTAVPPPAIAAPTGILTGLVSNLLSVVGLNPHAAGGPTPPAASPTMWTMLGFARREVGIQAVDSPLGTPQQLEAERIATQTYHTLPVALMKLVLRFGFTSAAQQQFSLVGGPDQANMDRLDAAVDEYAMAAAFQQQILNSNQPTVVMQVAPPHTWYGQSVPGSRILYDNPDTVYRFMGVNGASSYVIRGRFDGEMPADTTFSVLTGLTGNTASVLVKDQLVFDADGRSFTITADSRPADGRVNHLQLTSDSTLIASRNTLSDWATEVPMTLEIERVGGPPNSLFSQLGGFAIPGLGPAVVNNPLLTTLVSLVPPLPFNPPILRGAVAAVIMALGIQREATYMAVATTDPATGQRIEPNVLKNPTRNAEFLATQLQSAGYFQLADDEALVVTVHPNSARYFVLPVTDDWTITRDYWNEQTSLNNAQAEASPVDGSYTIVVSKNDPTVGGQHVANWVSTGGLDQGTISMRFQDLDPDAADNPPTVSSRVVKLADLAAELPADTAYLTPQGRLDQLAERKAGYDLRFAPYPQP